MSIYCFNIFLTLIFKHNTCILWPIPSYYDLRIYLLKFLECTLNLLIHEFTHVENGTWLQLRAFPFKVCDFAQFIYKRWIQLQNKALIWCWNLDPMFHSWGGGLSYAHYYQRSNKIENAIAHYNPKKWLCGTIVLFKGQNT
jgi:hypothetical protein